MSSSTHDDTDKPGRLVEMADGVFAYVQPDGSWWIINTGLLVGRRGGVSVDSCSTERRTRAYLDATASVTDVPVSTLVDTHHHGDHTHGNWLFPGATIVGHEGARGEVLAAGRPNWSGIWEPVGSGEIDWCPRSCPTPKASTCGWTICGARSGTWASPRTPRTTRSSGCPSRACCSRVTCCSAAAHHSS